MDAQAQAWQDAVNGPLRSGTDFDAHWRAYQEAFAGRTPEQGPPPAWVPDARTVDAANLTSLRHQVGADDYPALHRWTTTHREAFWGLVLDRLQVPMGSPPERVLGAAVDVEDPDWLPGARLNIAALCFQAPGDRIAVRQTDGDGTVTEWSYAELKQNADRVSHALARIGLAPGDAVALYTPMDAWCVAAYLGIVQAGLRVVSIPDSFAPAEVATRLRLGDA